MNATTNFPTTNAARYLGTPGKHFGHKVPVDFDRSQGRIELPCGQRKLTADETGMALADYMNRAFGTNRVLRPMSVEEYRVDRVVELGDFMGAVIAGIFEGIRNGAVDNPSHFEPAAGRSHIGWDTCFATLDK